MQGAAGHGEEMVAEGLLATGTEGGPTLREVVAQRVAAHRSRRMSAQTLQAEREAAMRAHRERMARENRPGASLVRDVVRARYERSQSYRDFLAAEAERALQQAQAEAEMAARKAQAVAAAQMQLLAEMEEWNRPEPGPREQALAEYQAGARAELAHELADIAMGARELMAEPLPMRIEEAVAATSGELFEEPAAPITEIAAGGLTVRLYENLGPSTMVEPMRRAGDQAAVVDAADAAMELEQLEHEIEFRRSPEFADHKIETLPLPANLIEFPRQLIAPRKARPRLAEGPLREDMVAEPQLRIFEVEPEQISTKPSTAGEVAADAPEWQSLLLDGTPEPLPQPELQRQRAQSLNIAPVHLRLMAAMVDGCCIGAAFLGFTAAAAEIAGSGLEALSKPALAGSALGALLLTALIYQLLFFTFAEATPGMRYARIGLCTFSDENPSRKAMRRRILATILAACPVGLGLLWVWMDDERLGWHDRISRMYQRAY
ncbi:MAG TPA: RDD family protein [Acidobacteriaceae bacterium]|jgi:uncharacterized RDD family membrane protein YckC|nr:RDD family protein [Acidobacteriaceae bacterium]